MRRSITIMNSQEQQNNRRHADEWRRRCGEGPFDDSS